MEIPKILLDTNILISLIIYGGEVEKVFYEMKNKRYEIYVSNYIDHEFRNKILQKWSKDKKIIFEIYESLAIPILESSFNELYVTRDPKDNPVISDAIINNMDILLTGDKDFVGLQTNVKIMNIAMMKEYLRTNKGNVD